MAAYPGQQPFQPQYASQAQPHYPQQQQQQAPPGGAYAVPAPNRDEQLMESFRAVCQRYEISEFFARRLKQLEGFEIVLILDDSGSMNTPLQNQAGASAFAKSLTRWDELKQTVGIIVDIGAIMDKDGLDIFFLNRATLSHHVLQAKKAIAIERKLLVIIATDGAPTNARGEIDTAALKHVLVSERNIDRVYVQFVACTDDDSTVAYLNEWDSKIPNVDVVDDYHSERAEILKAQGAKFKFTFGDYVVKTLLGSIDPEFDKLDEVKGGCCSVQ